jgi:hypothetical protein
LQRRDQFLQGLLELHRLKDPGAQRSTWRSSLASLAQACADDQPSPLDGLAPKPFAESMRSALALGFADDLGWLSPAAAAAALYEIAAALPAGVEKKDLGRRVLQRLQEGDAATFVALATRMALGTGKGLGGDGMRARVALVVALPARHGVRIDTLALALVARRELARAWVGAPAQESLADRKLAGRLLEQAARAAVRRAAEDDERSIGAFRGEAVAHAWRRLLDDREPAVWRHVAVARGLLAYHAPQHLDAIEQGLRPELSPTEWRRAATSAVAFGAVRPEQSLKLVREMLGRGLLKRDPGVAAALIWGIPAAAEVEPEMTEELLEDLFTEADPLIMAEALGEILPQGPGGAFGQRAVHGLLDLLGKAAPTSKLTGEVDDGAVALRARIIAGLRPRDEREPTIHERLGDALECFVEKGARAAYQSALEALEAVEGGLAALETLGDSASTSALARRASFAALRDIGVGLLDDGLLRDLLLLGVRGDVQRSIAAHEQGLDRLSRWLLEREQTPTPRSAPVQHRLLRMERLRAVLRLADARGGDEHGDAAVAQAIQARRFRLASLMLRHLVTRPPPVLHRTIAAAFSRAIDALLRDDSIDIADILLVIAQRGLAPEDLRMIFEASMHGDLRAALQAYLALQTALDAADGSSSALSGEFALHPGLLSGEFSLAGSPSSPPGNIVVTQITGSPAARKVEALRAFARDLEVDASVRVEALRGALFRLGRALNRLLNAPSLSVAAGSGSQETSPVRELERALDSLAQLCLGARQRLDDRPADALPSVPSLSLSSAIDAVLRGADTDGLVFAVASAREELAMGLPPVFVDIIASALEPLMTLPQVASHTQAAPAPAPVEKALPAWLPRRRTLGGFYVVRPLGSGAGGTVFVVRRIEDRHNEKAEHFALKVPDYDGNAARSLSEEQFLQLFREEATALLGLPGHPNLAKFVTFDLAARPKPILVMELVEGLALERLLQTGKLTVQPVLDILDGVLAGLEAMHSAGIGHLDVKPSNVILRGGRTPVLVDFGLSGRHIRPGCATLPYGAPEVWGLHLDGHSPTPPPVDIYAAACMAFEMLTTHDLFDGPSEMAIISLHLHSDGWPGPLRRLRQDPGLAPLADALNAALRRHPAQRSTAAQLRTSLRSLAGQLRDRPWPLRLPPAA